ncbi:MAG: alpha-(1-2)-phosphatidylinositol mannosyltransferase, partial [Actinomycetota bacterium]
SDLPAFQEVGGDAVRYFETGNSADLAATLIELFADPDTMEAMARAGSERAWKYDWGTVAASYREVYEAALS